MVCPGRGWSTACGVCARVCPTGALQMETAESGFQLIFSPQICIGCDICNQKGYKGRTAIFEILDVNEEIVKLVSNHAHEYEILEQARKDGTHLLIEAGIIKVRRGITTLEEVMRISLD